MIPFLIIDSPLKITRTPKVLLPTEHKTLRQKIVSFFWLVIFHIVPHTTYPTYYVLSLTKGGNHMAFGAVDVACGTGRGFGAGIAVVVVIILLLIALGIVF